MTRTTLRSFVGTLSPIVFCLPGLFWLARVSDAAPLYGPTNYLNPVASSEVSGFPITSIFNASQGDWAIDGATSNNPQGRDQGWFSVNLDQEYSISSILFAPRNATGSVDGINTINVWISTTPFSVDVTNATSTSSFLIANPTPTWTQSTFANNTPVTYALPTAVNGQYLVAELINTSDPDVNRNLGATQFVVDAVAVPEPSTVAMALASIACGGFSLWRRRTRA